MRLLPLLLLLISTLSAQPADYAIHFGHKAVVGERFRMTSTGTDEQAMMANINGNPMPPRLDSVTFELVAVCEVLDVTERGRERKAQFTIEKLVRTAFGKSTDVLPAGTVVVVERIDARNTIMIGNAPAPAAVTKILELAGVHMSGDREASDDDVFGTKERRKVGDTWPVNAVAAAESFSKRGMTVDPGKISGTCSIVEATQQDGIPVTRVAANVAMSGITPPGMPPGVNIDSTDVTASFSGLIPTDGISRRLQESVTLAMNVAASGTAPNGVTMTMTMTKKTTRETKYVRE